MLDSYEELKHLVDSVEDDVRKAAGGNKAAGTRVRKLMQDVKNAAQALRAPLRRSLGGLGLQRSRT